MHIAPCPHAAEGPEQSLPHALNLNTDVGSESGSDVEDDGEEVLGDFLAGRLENSTRSNYKSGLSSVVCLLEDCGRTGADAIDPNGDLVIPMTVAVWRAWLAEASKPVDASGKVRASSTVFGYVNAVKYAHTEKDERISTEVSMLIRKYEEAYKRNVSKLRQSGVMAATEGKQHFSMNVFGKLCKLALHSSEYRTPYSRFVHTYMVLCWNLFQR